MIRNPTAFYKAVAIGVPTFARSVQQWGFTTGSEVAAGAVALVGLVSLIVNRSPRLSAAMQDAEKADSFADWLLRVTGIPLVLFGLICVGAGGLFIFAGLGCLVVGGALILVARRGSADRRWRRAHARMFMGPPARRSRWYE